jgi:hypothetical protein
MAARRVDWSFGPGHGPISGVVNAAGSALGATMIADLAHVPPLWGLVGGATAAAGATIASVAHDAPGSALAYRALCWFGAGSWSAWALASATAEPFSGPWSTSALATLFVGTLGAAFVGRRFQKAEEAEEQQRQDAVQSELARLDAAALAGDHDRIAAVWQAELRRQTRREVTVVGVEFFEPNTGFMLDLELPPDGTTIEDIKPYEKTLAQALNVPIGCAVEVIDPNISRRVLHVRVGTYDAMADDHHLPAGCEPDSIENDLSIGIRSDRSEATVNIRYNNMVLVGQVDSGKSNQLNVLTDRLVRCTDALVWAIDLTGNGRYPRPWVRAWKEGRAEAPAIDWIAPNEDEARLMTKAAMAIIEGRTADYEQLMFEQGWDKIMVSPEIPEIVIVTDEFGSLPMDVKENLQQISDTGRGAGVRAVSCALEATGRYIPNQLITQARERVGMRVQDETQLQYLFDRTWRSGRFDMSTMRVKGSGLVSSDAAPPEKFKGWRIEPQRIDADSITVGPWRPELDELSENRCDVLTAEVKNADGYKVKQRFDRVYSGRWDRTLPTIFPAARVPGQRADAGAQRKTVTAGREQRAEQEQVPALGDALANLETARQALRDVEPVEDPGPRGDDGLPPLPADVDFGVVESWLVEGAPATDAAGKPKPHPRKRMHQIVWDAGNAGIGPTAVHKVLEGEGYGTTYQTVNGWMKDDARDGILNQDGARAPYTRGPKMTDPHAG